MWDLIVSVPDHCLSFYFLYMQSESRHWRSLLTLGALNSVIIRHPHVNNMHEYVKLNKFLHANGW